MDAMNIKNKEVSQLLNDFNSQGGKLPFITPKYVILPGLCDVHVHFREPGFSYKETIKSGSAAAARGGYTTVCPMPNLSPFPDTLEHLNEELDIIKRDASIEVIPYGTITKGEKGEELSDMEDMLPYVCAYSDDGKGVQKEDMMKKGMEKAALLNKVIAAHCEENSLLHGGYIHDGEYAKLHNHKGICSASEYVPIIRDCQLTKLTGVKYHVCHISAKESVEAVRNAKKEGINVTCETGPHYLILTDMDLKEEGRFKMNPPLRSKEDREALLKGIKDGTIDMISTDHAPHSEEEKSRGLEKSPFGIVGLETSFPLLYTHLVKTGFISMEKLMQLMCINPRKRFDLPLRKDDLAVFEISSPYRIDSSTFLSKGRSTPFDKDEVYGKCVLTICKGKIVYEEQEEL